MHKFLSFLLIGFVAFACHPNTQHTDEQSTRSDGLDLSRSNAVKNTPSREGETATSMAQEAAEVMLPDASFPLIQHLPEGVAVPNGMIFIPGGDIDMGSAEGLPREQPVHKERIQGFFLKKTPVTVAEYRQFVEATGYKTQAESFGNSAVFDLKGQQWYLQDGAHWAYPQGSLQPAAPDDHPVTQVSWQDAVAYCDWAGQRLPTEAEWEHAARAARNQRERYPWGIEIKATNGDYRANIWQGVFPAYNTGEDGYLFTSPVGAFGETPIGLTDMSGNVWEWCQDWYRSYDPNRPGLVQTAEPERVMRGGSFMCDPSYCHGYRVSGRSGSTPETGLFHVGFRTVQEIPRR